MTLSNEDSLWAKEKELKEKDNEAKEARRLQAQAEEEVSELCKKLAELQHQMATKCLEAGAGNQAS